MTEKYDIKGMTCAACVAHVEKAVKALDGVEQCEVNLVTNKLSVTYSGLTEKDIVTAVKNAGYGASKEGGKVRDESMILLWRFVISAVIMLPLMYFSMGHMWGFNLGGLDPHINPIGYCVYQWVLTSAVMGINYKFFISGAKAVFHKSANMDTLVSLGSAAAYIYGVVITCLAIAAPTTHAAADYAMELYFESAAMILALVTLGKFLEAKSKNRTKTEITKLLKLAPEKANVLVDGKEQSLPVERIAVGDRIVIRAGDKIPCDGFVEEGALTVDTGALTGESIPVELTVSSAITSATVCISGYAIMRANKVGVDTALSKIIALVENAGGSKAPIQKIADKVSAVFVPVVTAIAAITLIVWLCLGYGAGFSLARAISVLVISCPCALGLATPVAVMAGTGKAAANGVLIKNAEVLQRLQDAEIVALDKTATITEGKPRVTSVRSYANLSEHDALSIAAALESVSTHPLAKAITEAVSENDFIAKDCEYKIGYGVFGTVNGVKYGLGSARLMAEKGVTVEDAPNTVYLFSDKLEAMIAVEDTVKEGSKRAVELLSRADIRTVMITGDNKVTADAVAAVAGVGEVYHSVLPDGKLEIIEKLKKQGVTVMVGDGINDAPALKSADAGVAIGSGTDVAIEAADVVLVKSDLRDVPKALAVSHMTMRNVKQNLFWAFFYNTVGIPIAAGVFYSLGVLLDPMIAALAMAFSSIFVVCNALRLTVMSFDDKHIERKLGKHKNRRGNNKKGDNGTNDNTSATGGADACNESVNLTEQVENKIGTETEVEMKQTIKIYVNGMTCKHCQARVESALKSVRGVKKATVNLPKRLATVIGEDIDEAELKAAVVAAGYDVI